jgi:ribosomal protein L29
LTIAELQQKARETKEELFNLRFQLRTGHLSDFSRVKARAARTPRFKPSFPRSASRRQQHGAA